MLANEWKCITVKANDLMNDFQTENYCYLNSHQTLLKLCLGKMRIKQGQNAFFFFFLISGELHSGGWFDCFRLYQWWLRTYRLDPYLKPCSGSVDWFDPYGSWSPAAKRKRRKHVTQSHRWAVQSKHAKSVLAYKQGSARQSYITKPCWLINQRKITKRLIAVMSYQI